MTFEQLLDAAAELLQRRRRLTHAALRRQFGLDDETLRDLVHELVRGQQLAANEGGDGGDVLVWLGADAAPAPATAAAPPPAPRADAERRQLTILFCDLVESSALANTLDPEELRTVLRAFQDSVGAVIARNQGFVNSYLGDGIVVFFGYPQAREDDAVRAVRTGLEIIGAVAALRPLADIRPQARIGVATGVVVVGDVIGAGASREESVVGNTSNLAARLQAVAAPGEVVIAGPTRRLVGRRFDCIELPSQRLKGWEQPVPAWRVAAERRVEDILADARADDELGPLVDRVVELPALLDAWHSARDGRGRVVTLRGEAGLGKSRLTQALRQAAAGDAPVMLLYCCSERFQNTALYPVIRQLHHVAGIDDDDADAVQLDKLERLLQRVVPPAELAATLPYLAALLAIVPDGRLPPLVDSPERQRELTLRALEMQLLGLAQQQPVLMIVEDLHWVDPSTLQLLDQLARKLQAAPVLLLGTARPSFEPPWAALAHALTIDLSLLERDDRSSIVAHHAGGKALPPEIVEHILLKSDGNPLYVEELTKAMLESGLLLDQDGRWVLTGPLRTLTVPSTLHDSLLARLDHPAVDKDVVQAGAAIGREFGDAMLASVLQAPSAALQGTLDHLTDAGLLHRRGGAADAVYTFKHALIQDAAYATMLRGKRQQVHARIARVLQADAAGAAREPELLAHHLVEAALPAEAIPYLMQAGLAAGAAAAHTEACKHFSEGLRLVAGLPDDGARNRLELGLRVHHGMSLAATRGFAAPEVEATNQRARDLCRAIGDSDELFWVLRGLCALYIVRFDLASARELSAQLVRLGEETQRPEFLVEGYLMLGYTLGYAGEPQPARAALEKVVAVARAGGPPLVFPTPQDPTMAALTLLALVCLSLGDAEAAAGHIADALRTAQASPRTFDLAYAQACTAIYHNVRHEGAPARQHALLAIEISQRHGFAFWFAAGHMQLGIANARLGAWDESVALIGGTLPAWQGAGSELNVGFCLAGMALAHHGAGRTDAALETVDRAIAHAQRHGERFYESEMVRMRGEFVVARDAAAARADFEQAIAIAQHQGARLFELRAATCLARLLADAGEHRRAHALLAPALAQLPRAADTDDARQAEALLATLDALAA